MEIFNTSSIDEYWNSIGEDEDDAAEEFLKQIKTQTEAMRYGNDNGEIYLDVSLPYNQEFLPHWREFAHALEQYQYCLKCSPYDDNESMFQLRDVGLPDTVIQLLSNALKLTHFQMLHLENNNLGQKGIAFAVEYLQNNHILKQFYLTDNTIDMKGVKLLCKVLKDHQSIEALALQRCFVADVDGYEMLKSIMSAGREKLKVLNLSENGISTGGDTFMSDFLTDNPMLETLVLTENQLDDNDAYAFASALKHNTKLRRLCLSEGNSISMQGWKAFLEANFDDTSLNSAADSNHTCGIAYPTDVMLRLGDFGTINGYALSGTSFDPVYARQKKIYSILSSRNRKFSNADHFGNI